MSFRSNFLTRKPDWHNGRYRGTVYHFGKYNDYDVVDLYREHGQLRWNVFAMSWSIIGWCASYDAQVL